MNERLRPQPAPVADASPEVWPTIFGNVNLCLPAWLEADMRARHELGRKRYGVALQQYYELLPKEEPRLLTPSGKLKLPEHLEVRRFVVAELGTQAAYAAFGARRE